MNTSKITAKTEIWLSQKKRVFRALYKKPATRLQVSNAENVPLQNVCRYIHDFREARCVAVVRIDRDPISKMKAEYLTTNPELIPGHGQIKLFE